MKKLVLLFIVLNVISNGFADDSDIEKLENKIASVKTKNGKITIKIPSSSSEKKIEDKIQQKDTLKTKAIVLNPNNNIQKFSITNKPSTQTNSPINGKILTSILSTKSELVQIPLEERIARLSAILNFRFEQNQNLFKANKENPSFTQLRNKLRFRSRLRPDCSHYRRPYY